MGIDHIEELVNESIANVHKDPAIAQLMDSGRIKLIVGDGRQGSPADGPFDAIHVGAAAPEIPPAVGEKFEY